MIKIENRKGKIKDQETTFSKILCEIISVPTSKEGWDIPTLKLHLAIEAKLIQHEQTEISLEILEFQEVKKCVQAQRWVVLAPFIVELDDYINSVK